MMSRSTDQHPASMSDPATQASPFGYYQQVHSSQPVKLDTATGLWVIAGHAELAEAARNWEVFSSEIDMRRGVSRVDSSAADELLRRDGWIAPDVLSQVDPPRHTRFRRLVAGLFTGPAVNRLQSYLDAHIVELLDRLPADLPVDFMTHFAIPLPIDVIADQLGVPREDAPLLKRWTDAIIETLNAMITADRKLACTREIVDFQRYFVQLRERKMREPRNDILSTLAVANTDEGVALTTEEFIAICAQLMVAGNETTRNHLAKGAWLLTQRADLLQALHDEPTLAARFVDETLRLESPVQGLFRRCTRDYPLGGAVIPAGARVVLLYGAANRDPREFPDPAELRLDRPNVTRHMAFGHGIHGCVGRVLATAELTAAFRHLTQRFEKIELDPSACEPAHKPHFSLRGLDSLSLILTRRM